MRAGGDFVRRYAVLLPVCLILTLFAISNQIVFHDKTLVEIPLPELILSLCGIFRASARLFYPVYYLLFLFVLRYVFRHFEKPAHSLLLLVLVLVQLADLSAVVVQKHHFFAHTPQVQTLLSDETLARQAEKSDFLLLLEDSNVNHYYTAFAAKHQLKTNIHVVNSGAYPLAVEAGQQALAQLLAGQIQPGTLYLAEQEQTLQQLRQALAGQPVEFYPFEGYTFIYMTQ